MINSNIPPAGHNIGSRLRHIYLTNHSDKYELIIVRVGVISRLYLFRFNKVDELGRHLASCYSLSLFTEAKIRDHKVTSPTPPR